MLMTNTTTDYIWRRIWSQNSVRVHLHGLLGTKASSYWANNTELADYALSSALSTIGSCDKKKQSLNNKRVYKYSF